MRSLLWLESEARGRLEQGDGAAQRVMGSVELADPPAPTTLAGFAFNEFGVDEAGAVTLAALLAQLGFTRVGRHRSKQVTLFRQGEILLIRQCRARLRRRASASSSRARASAPSACSRTTRRARSSRATALLSARFDSSSSAPKRRCACRPLRSPGGMLVHFVPAELGAAGLAAADFILDAGAT